MFLPETRRWDDQHHPYISSPSSNEDTETRALTMASSSLATAFISSHSSSYYTSITPFSSNFAAFRTNPRTTPQRLSIKALTLDFSGGSFFEDDNDNDDDEPLFAGLASGPVEDKEEIQCPPGLRQYEAMAVLRPDMSEDERLTLTQKYEELLVAGGGMYVEVFNRGVIPLAYAIKRKNRDGETNTYLDGIYLMFTFFTKPESMLILEETFNTDDNIIRTSTFKVRKRKY